MGDFEFAGVSEFRKAIDTFVTRENTATRAAVAAAAHVIEASAKEHFSGSHAKGLPHVGGSEPNVVSGSLRRSIHVEGPVSNGLFSWTAKVGPSTVYARAIELGLRQNRSVKYPYFGPGFTESLPRVRKIMTAAWAV